MVKKQKIIEILNGLLEWAENTGGWDGEAWVKARAFRDELQNEKNWWDENWPKPMLKKTGGGVMEKGWKPNASKPMLTMLAGDTLDLTCRCGEHQRIHMEEIHKGSGPLNPSADMTLWEQDRPGKKGD